LDFGQNASFPARRCYSFVTFIPLAVWALLMLAFLRDDKPQKADAGSRLLL
jgi:hypothetical protein